LENASQKARMLETSQIQKSRKWDGEKNILLESILNLTNQIQALERDYNFLRARFSNLQKSSRCIDSEIKLRSCPSEAKMFDRYNTFEMASLPKEMEQKKQEIHVLRKQLHIFSKQSKFQQEQLLLSRQEVDALFCAQSLASDENLRLAEVMTSAELSWASLERRCTDAVIRASESKETIKLLRGRILEQILARVSSAMLIRVLARWKSLVRSKTQLMAIGIATRRIVLLEEKCPAEAALTVIFNAWSRKMRGQRRLARRRWGFRMKSKT
jgi:hypothetical protein